MAKSPSRVAAVLVGLMVSGTLFGAVAGAVAAVAFMAAYALRGHPGSFDLVGCLIGAFIGGVCGAVLAPLASFTMWRRVPLGRLFVSLTIGTIVGGSAASLLFPDSFFLALFGGLLGFLFAGDRLASRARRLADKTSAPTEA